MTAPILAATIFCSLFTAVQITSIALAIVRLRRKSQRAGETSCPSVSLVRPLCGIDNYATETLRSTFELDHPCYEILLWRGSRQRPRSAAGRSPDRRLSKCDRALTDRRRSCECQSQAQQRRQGLARCFAPVDRHRRQQRAHAARLHSAAICQLGC